MKKILLCDGYAYVIEDDDFGKLQRSMPAFARLVRDTDCEAATHFVCEACGQIPPIKLRALHKCRRENQ